MSTIKVDTVRPVTADASLTLQGDNSGTGVSGITIDSSGNATFAQTISAGTIGSSVVFPSGHILQSKVAVLAPTTISTSSTTFQAVSGLDLTLTRSANTYVVYMLMGGGPFTDTTGHSMYVTVKRSDGSSYSGTNESDLGASSDYGISRFYGGNSPIMSPHSGAALDTSNISGSYTYRVFYRSSTSAQNVQFSNTDRSNTVAIIFEFNPS